MVDYKIVKYCRLCKERFVVMKCDAKKVYCDKCWERVKNFDKDD